jgi:tellurite resistance protein
MARRKSSGESWLILLAVAGGAIVAVVQGFARFMQAYGIVMIGLVVVLASIWMLARRLRASATTFKLPAPSQTTLRFLPESSAQPAASKPPSTPHAGGVPNPSSPRQSEANPSSSVPQTSSREMPGRQSPEERRQARKPEPVVTLVRETPPPKPASAVRTARWIPPGQPVTVRGLVIPEGMVYVGTDSRLPDASLIDPSLKISFDRSRDYTISQLGYWPRYADASPASRGAYLAWLADGKRAPNADIGFVFLYFYGLERRILTAAAADPPTAAELSLLQGEIIRLLEIYSDNGSFRDYASSLLAFLRARELAESDLPETPPTWPSSWELPFELRVGLARYVAQGLPIPGAWAYAWWQAHPTTRLRTVAERCPEEFQQLFIEYYREKFQPGLKLRPNKTRLTAVHRVASPSLPKRQYEHPFDLPDVTLLTAPLKKLQAIADYCYQALDRYSRHIGRKPQNTGKIDALLELPTLLWPKAMKQPLLKIHHMVSASGLSLAVKFEKLLSLLPPWETIDKTAYTGFLRSLSQIGLGIEPDPRFGGELPDRAQIIVLFVEAPQALMVEPTPRYKTAALSLQLAVVVSLADGEIGSHEREVLMRQLEDWLHLEAGERARLHAHLRRLVADPPGLGGLKKRVEELSPPAREALGDFLVRVAQADGVISPSEVKLLERLFKLLELDVQGVYGKLHASAGEPVTVRLATGSGSGFAIPARPAEPVPGGLELDFAKVSGLQEDTDRVSNILHAIFNEAPPTSSSNPERTPEAQAPAAETMLETLWGLSPAYSELLQVLLSRSRWSRTELEELAADRGLLLDGALEHINEAAFDRFDQALTEGDDPLEINLELVEERTT